jgi:predicted amidohydrolase
MKTNLILHQTHHTLADFDAIFQTLVNVLKGDGLHLFPELYLTGYPLQDLVLQRPFIDSYESHLKDLDQWAKGQTYYRYWKMQSLPLTSMVKRHPVMACNQLG